MPTSVTTPPPELSDIDLYQLAQDFLDALLSAADVDTIGMTRWWERAKTSIETAAASSDTWGQCVSRAARKLQIDTPDDRLAKAVAQLTPTLADPGTYRRWARLVERDAVYITALVRETRTARNATRPKKPKSEPKTEPKPTEEPACLPF